jgi:hypothetical protein
MTVYIHSSVAEGDPNIIDTTSHSEGWNRDLSPFYLGPVDLWGGYISQTVENAWQYARLYACHVDENGDPTDEWWKWAKAGWDNPRAVRYPMGKGTRPLCAYWNGEKLGYIEARARIYCPLYAEAVQRTEGWKKLKRMYEEKGEIHIWSFDSYDHRALGMNYTDVLKSSARKMGHGFVLACLLENKRVWENWIKPRSLF